ncbi:hypothetical protein MAM1_0777c11229 [Mucor ambiguus]|uniref:Uncharacterized protein n=1 Tax=Mucor ambiguus TaxID=91626 RepID=A0A0C9LZ53_9FUNG|nr:hypothetical protein MAM1_0777c11229 [Mucor ambiguus]
MTGKRGQASTASKRQLRSKDNIVNTKTAKKDQQSPKESDTAHNRKIKTAIIRNLNEKRPRAFALEHDYYDRRRCHARYKAIITNMAEAEQSRLLQEFESWCLTLNCKEFWKERKRKYALATAASNCSEAVDNLLVSDSQGLLESQNQTSAVELPTPHPAQETTASQLTATTTTAYLDPEHNNTLQESENEEKHWIVDGNDITSLFLKYRYQADIIFFGG